MELIERLGLKNAKKVKESSNELVAHDGEE